MTQELKKYYKKLSIPESNETKKNLIISKTGINYFNLIDNQYKYNFLTNNGLILNTFINKNASYINGNINLYENASILNARKIKITVSNVTNASEDDSCNPNTNLFNLTSFNNNEKSLALTLNSDEFLSTKIGSRNIDAYNDNYYFSISANNGRLNNFNNNSYENYLDLAPESSSIQSIGSIPPSIPNPNLDIDFEINNTGSFFEIDGNNHFHYKGNNNSEASYSNNKFILSIKKGNFKETNDNSDNPNILGFAIGGEYKIRFSESNNTTLKFQMDDTNKIITIYTNKFEEVN